MLMEIQLIRTYHQIYLKASNVSVRHIYYAVLTLAIEKGWRPVIEVGKFQNRSPMLLMKVADAALKQKLQLNYSDSYKKDLIRTHRLFFDYLREQRSESILITEISIELLKPLFMISLLHQRV